MDRLGVELNRNGIESSALNIVSFRFRNYDKSRRPLWLVLLALVHSIPKVRGVLLRLFRTSCIIKISKRFDLIDVHYYSTFYDSIIPKLKEQGKKIKVTVWGSDFFRVDAKRREEQRRIYNTVERIQFGTPQVSTEFLKVFPECKSKIEIGHFGNNKLTSIDKQLSDSAIKKCKKQFNIQENKIVLTCGTNASEGHRHLLLLDEIANLAPATKSKFFIVLPMNYGGTPEYISKVEEKVRSIGVPYLLLTDFLSNDEFAKIVVISDIILTIQITDSFSAAIQEYLYAGNYLLAGNWLPYDIFTENGIDYRRITLSSIKEGIEETITNFIQIKSKNAGNRAKIHNLSAWDSVINKWIIIYKKMLN